MRVFNIATELVPFHNPTGLGARIASLLDALAGRGHDVHVIAPIERGAELGAFPLARRLKPFVVESGGGPVRFTRFEGRTTSGVNVNLLQPDAALAPEAARDAFPLAAVDVMAAIGGEAGACLAWGGENAGVSIPHLLVLGDTAGFEARVEERSAFVVPVAIDAHPPLSAADKSSAKAALQAAFALPVRSDVPLALFAGMPDDARAQALADYLRGDVQAVLAVPAQAEGAPLAALAARYPDRLSLLPAETPLDALLAGADLCVSTLDPLVTVRAISYGAVPITVAACAEGAVDLEPSLASGIAFVAADGSATAFAAALGRAVSAFRTGEPFRALARRIQRHALDWAACAERIEQLIQAR
jgi:glycogen synthase